MTFGDPFEDSCVAARGGVERYNICRTIQLVKLSHLLLKHFCTAMSNAGPRITHKCIISALYCGDEFQRRPTIRPSVWEPITLAVQTCSHQC